MESTENSIYCIDIPEDMEEDVMTGAEAYLHQVANTRASDYQVELAQSGAISPHTQLAEIIGQIHSVSQLQGGLRATFMECMDKDEEFGERSIQLSAIINALESCNDLLCNIYYNMVDVTLFINTGDRIKDMTTVVEEILEETLAKSDNENVAIGLAMAGEAKKNLREATENYWIEREEEEAITDLGASSSDYDEPAH